MASRPPYNQEKARLYRARYRKAHPDRIPPAEYWVYLAARQRCVNPKTRDYKHYGGRGIEFRFTSFRQFIEEVGPRPAGPYGSGRWENLTLERINNDGHYEPGNVRWATWLEQSRNKRKRQKRSA